MSTPVPFQQFRSNVAIARHDRDIAALALRATQEDIVLAVHEAVRAVERDAARVQLASETMRVAALALEADQELFREGKGASRNVVSSLEALEEAQVSYLQAEIDLQQSRFEVGRVSGTLLSDVGIDLQ